MRDQNKRVSPLLTEEQISYVVGVLEHGILFNKMLSSFERVFVEDVSAAYSRSGDKLIVSSKQWGILNQINHRLRLRLVPPEAPVDPVPTEETTNNSGEANGHA